MQRQLLAFAGLASLATLCLVAASAWAPASPAAVGLATGSAAITGASTTPSSVAGRGTTHLTVSARGVKTYTLTTSCPRLVHVKIGSADICDSVLRVSAERLRRQIVGVTNLNHVKGTVTFTIDVVDPKVAVSSSTRAVVSLGISDAK